MKTLISSARKTSPPRNHQRDSRSLFKRHSKMKRLNQIDGKQRNYLGKITNICNSNPANGANIIYETIIK